MRITELVSENVKRIRAIHLTAEQLGGNTVVIGGKNEQGKSSAIDSIMYALGGAKAIPSSVVRKGQEQAHVMLKLSADPDRHLSALTVTRVIEKSGKTTLEITTDDGYNAPTPQTILDDLCSRIAFDPLEFTRLKPKDQLATLRSVVGLDFTELDAKRKKLYDERTVVNRSGVALKAKVDGIVIPEDCPDEEVSVSELLAELQAMQKWNRDLEKQKATHQHWVNEVNRKRATIEQIKKQLAEAVDALTPALEALESVEVSLSDSEEIDTQPITEKLESAGTVNAMVAKKQAKAAMVAELDATRQKAIDLGNQIKAIDTEKQNLMAQAEWPLPGLGFDEEGVTMNGLPFEVASQAEQIAISVEMGFAMNPGLKVLLCRDASLLDDDHLEAVSKIAEKHDGQLFLERVGSGAECKVIIVDGRVATEDEVSEMRGETVGN